ncbi:MAG: hypothetical protein KGL20_05205 [Rhodospirillales bacterium]|nr:hypothetical protein [Rhodospirillales bacterium]
MTEHDREFGALSEKVVALTNDIEEVKEDVKELKFDMKRILAYMDREEGGRVARDKLQAQWDREAGTSIANKHFQIELTWTKIMAMAAVIGSLTGLIALAPHFIFHLG